MKFALCGLAALFTVMIAMVAATPAEAHGGVEYVLLAGLIGIIVAGLACIVGLIITFFVIYKCSRHFSRKNGKPPTSKIKIAILTPIAFFVFTVIVFRVLTYGTMQEIRAQKEQETAEYIARGSKPAPPTPEEVEDLKKRIIRAEWDHNSHSDLGDTYLYGRGTPQDCVEAYFWYTLYGRDLPKSSSAWDKLNLARNACKELVSAEQQAAIDLRVQEWQKKHP